MHVYLGQLKCNVCQKMNCWEMTSTSNKNSNFSHLSCLLNLTTKTPAVNSFCLQIHCNISTINSLHLLLYTSLTASLAVSFEASSCEDISEKCYWFQMDGWTDRLSDLLNYTDRYKYRIQCLHILAELM